MRLLSQSLYPRRRHEVRSGTLKWGVHRMDGVGAARSAAAEGPAAAARAAGRAAAGIMTGQGDEARRRRGAPGGRRTEGRHGERRPKASWCWPSTRARRADGRSSSTPPASSSRAPSRRRVSAPPGPAGSSRTPRSSGRRSWPRRARRWRRPASPPRTSPASASPTSARPPSCGIAPLRSRWRRRSSGRTGGRPASVRSCAPAAPRRWSGARPGCCSTRTSPAPSSAGCSTTCPACASVPRPGSSPSAPSTPGWRGG